MYFDMIAEEVTRIRMSPSPDRASATRSITSAAARNAADPPDALDLRIIEALQRNPHLTNRGLARELGVAQSTVSARLKQLRESRMLRLVPAVDAVAAGFDLFVLVGVRANGRLLEQVVGELGLIPEVIAIHIVSGGYDLSARMIARDRRHLREILEQRIGTITGVTQIQCDIVLGVLLFGPSLRAEREFPKLELAIRGTDELDREIIRRLQQDPRTPLSWVARDAGVSEGTVRVRFRKLQDRGLLRVLAVTDPRAAGADCLSWVGISVSPARLSTAARVIARKGPVKSLVYTLGGSNLLALVAVEHRDVLARFLTDDLLHVPGVERTVTGELLRVVKHDDGWTVAPDVPV